jgi:hypothetical protein
MIKKPAPVAGFFMLTKQEAVSLLEKKQTIQIDQISQTSDRQLWPDLESFVH